DAPARGRMLRPGRHGLEARRGEPDGREPFARPGLDDIRDELPHGRGVHRPARQPFPDRVAHPWPRMPNSCWIMSFEMLITCEEAWKPRWTRMRSPNCWERSTLDASIWRGTSLPMPSWPLASSRTLASPLPM